MLLDATTTVKHQRSKSSTPVKAYSPNSLTKPTTDSPAGPSSDTSSNDYERVGRPSDWNSYSKSVMNPTLAPSPFG